MNQTHLNGTAIPDCGPRELHLEWPSAFFSLLCLALNSLTQPSGRMCNLPYTLRFLARSSPVICSFDAISVLFLWARYSIQYWENPRRSAARVIHSRFYGIDEGVDDTLTTLERNFAFRCAVFGLGVLPSAVKLFACRGVVWVQVVAAVYLVSWGVSEILMLCARGHGNFESSLPGQSSRDTWIRTEAEALYMVMAIAAHIAVFNAGWLFNLGSDNLPGRWPIKVPSFLIMIYPTMIWGFLMGWKIDFWLMRWACGFLFTLMSVLFLGIGFGHLTLGLEIATLLGLCVGIGLGCVLFLEGALWGANLFFTIGGFCIWYHSERTYKPHWVDYLG